MAEHTLPKAADMDAVSYEHAGKPYTVLVHGQTGRVHGRAPWSWGCSTARSICP